MVLASGDVGPGYRPGPLPAGQQGSLPQMGRAPAVKQVAPTPSQQQHPLQSIHVEVIGSGPQLHAEPSPPASVEPLDDPASVDPPELLLEDPPLEELPLAAPLLEDPPLEELPLAAPLLEDPPLEELPPAAPLLEDPPPPPLPLFPQASSPTVEDAPVTTSTWKSFSIFMPERVDPCGQVRNPVSCEGLAASEALRCLGVSARQIRTTSSAR